MAKAKHTYEVNGNSYYKKRYPMPDGTLRFVSGKNYQDWRIKAQIKYDDFYKNTPEQIALDKILLKDEISEYLESIRATRTQKTYEEYVRRNYNENDTEIT